MKGSWKQNAQIAPHVLLALVNTVMNISLAIAIGQGVAIAWWRRALKGSTVEDLHRSWGFSSSILQLITAGKSFNLIALAALMAKVSLVDNILLQRAAGTTADFYVEPGVKVSLPMVTALPAGYTGALSQDSTTDAAGYAFSCDIAQYQSGTSTIDLTDMFVFANGTEGFNTNCTGLCDTTFPSFGFDVTCSDALAPLYQITPTLASNNSFHAFTNNTNASVSALASNPLLAVQPFFVPANTRLSNASQGSYFGTDKTYPYSSIGLSVTWSNYTSNGGDRTTCTGHTQRRFCSLRPAVLNNSLSITNIADKTGLEGFGLLNNGITWNPWGSATFTNTGHYNGVNTIQPAYEPYDSTYDSNLQSITQFLINSFATYVNMKYVTTANKSTYVPNNLGGLFGQWWLNYDPSMSCAIEVDDPTPNIIDDLNHLMFISSMRAATNYSMNSKTRGVPLVKNIQTHGLDEGMLIETVRYTTNWWFGGAAMIIGFLITLCCLPSYWGFWVRGDLLTDNHILSVLTRSYRN